VLAADFTPLPASEQISGVALGAVAVLATYRVWHGRTADRLNGTRLERPSRYVLAAFPALTASWCAAMLGVIALDLANVHNGLFHAAVIAVILITFVAAVAGVLFGFSIMGFRKPRRLIPPPLRPHE
jgi:hypothetical protein